MYSHLKCNFNIVSLVPVLLQVACNASTHSKLHRRIEQLCVANVQSALFSNVVQFIQDVPVREVEPQAIDENDHEPAARQ